MANVFYLPFFELVTQTTKRIRHFKKKSCIIVINIKTVFYKLMHRCTQVENPGEGVPDVFDKICRGGSRLSVKIAWGGSPYFGFYCILIHKCFEKLTLPPPPPGPTSPPPVCIYELM